MDEKRVEFEDWERALRDTVPANLQGGGGSWRIKNRGGGLQLREWMKNRGR